MHQAMTGMLLSHVYRQAYLQIKLYTCCTRIIGGLVVNIPINELNTVPLDEAVHVE